MSNYHIFNGTSLSFFLKSLPHPSQVPFCVSIVPKERHNNGSNSHDIHFYFQIETFSSFSYYVGQKFSFCHIESYALPLRTVHPSSSVQVMTSLTDNVVPCNSGDNKQYFSLWDEVEDEDDDDHEYMMVGDNLEDDVYSPTKNEDEIEPVCDSVLSSTPVVEVHYGSRNAPCPTVEWVHTSLEQIVTIGNEDNSVDDIANGTVFQYKDEL